MGELYEAVKFWQHPDKKPKVLRRDLTLEEARKFCDDPEQSSMTAHPPKGCGGDERKIQKWHEKQKHWFVGYMRQV